MNHIEDNEGRLVDGFFIQQQDIGLLEVCSGFFFRSSSNYFYMPTFCPKFWAIMRAVNKTIDMIENNLYNKAKYINNKFILVD